MALESLFIRVTNTTSASIFLADIESGFTGQNAAMRVNRPGPVYVPANDSVELALSGPVLLSYESGAIRQQVDAGNLTVSQVGGAVQVHTWQYDFSVDGGAQGAFTLKGLDGLAKELPVCLMLRGWLEVVTAPVSAGTPTGKIGYTADDDGFITTNSNIETGWTAGSIIPFNGAKVCNGIMSASDVTAQVVPASTKNASASSVLFTLGGADITAGKINVHLEILPVFA
tara:strand:- start:18552 stop:19235 length:684 start_codon:yes stop_codon:yes gene_type:complete